LAILPDLTANGSVIFAKNSDREPNEAQEVVALPARDWPQGQQVTCTYIAIPQVRHTCAVVLSKPFQMWGAEMGVNEHGLAIGNEAVFTKVPFGKRNDGLTGMDLLRLALERCQTAESAVNTIVALLERYGQDACGGYTNRSFFYHNSFLIADPREVWLLETVDRLWAARRIAQGAVSISNGLTLHTDYDRLSPAAPAFAKKRGWWDGRGRLPFARTFSDRFYTRMSNCRVRRQLTQTAARGPGLSVQDAMRILRQHNLPDDRFTPAKATTASVCMHATGPWNPSSTTGSMVVELPPNGAPRIWLTGTSYPCISAFKPFRVGSACLAADQTWNRPGALPDGSLWWQSERMARMLAVCWKAWQPALRAELDALEREGLTFDWAAAPEEQDRFSRSLVEKHLGIVQQWHRRLETVVPRARWRHPLRSLWPALQQRQLNALQRD
ncbi:MAG: acyl-CoA--6-aminopenicillanic acid acyltransferase, partial [Bacteroidetes bacterium]